MTLPTSAPITLKQIQTEFGGPGNLISYYAGGGHVQSGAANGTGHAIPTSGVIDFFNFYGASALTLPTSLSSNAAFPDQNTQLSAIGFGGSGTGLYVVSNANATIWSSATGLTWTKESSGPPVQVNVLTILNENIPFINGNFVISTEPVLGVGGGNGGVYAYSSDGITWTWRQMSIGSGSSNSFNYALNSPIYGQSLYVMAGQNAFGNGSAISVFTASSLTSNTGWTAHSVGGIGSSIVNISSGMSQAGSVMMFLCSDGSGNPISVTSSDGVTWTATSTSGFEAPGIAEPIISDGTTFYATTSDFVWSSTDGINFTKFTNTTYQGGINGQLLCYANNGIFLSASGNNSGVQMILSNPTTGTWANVAVPGVVGSGSSPLGPIQSGNGTVVLLAFSGATSKYTSWVGTV